MCWRGRDHASWSPLCFVASSHEASIIALALFAVGALDYPFGTGVQVDPTAFELTLEKLDTSRLSDL